MFYISLNHSTLLMYVVHKVLNGVFEGGRANDPWMNFMNSKSLLQRFYIVLIYTI